MFIAKGKHILMQVFKRTKQFLCKHDQFYFLNAFLNVKFIDLKIFCVEISMIVKSILKAVKQLNILLFIFFLVLKCPSFKF